MTVIATALETQTASSRASFVLKGLMDRGNLLSQSNPEGFDAFVIKTKTSLHMKRNTIAAASYEQLNRKLYIQGRIKWDW
jgi:hypothetical protein